MAILLRNTRTGYFYVGYNRWRVYPEEAFDFQTLERASRWLNSIHLSEVEIVQVPGATQNQEKEEHKFPDVNG